MYVWRNFLMAWYNYNSNLIMYWNQIYLNRWNWRSWPSDKIPEASPSRYSYFKGIHSEGVRKWPTRSNRGGGFLNHDQSFSREFQLASGLCVVCRHGGRERWWPEFKMINFPPFLKNISVLFLTNLSMRKSNVTWSGFPWYLNLIQLVRSCI